MTDRKIEDKPIRPASTVILVREYEEAFQVYLLKRSRKSGFMGGFYVFPGGVVDAEDRGVNVWKDNIDLELDQIETKLGNGIAFEDIFGFSVAGIRETLEEAGVFLAEEKGKSKEDFEHIRRVRLKSDLTKSWFRDKVIEGNWTLAFSSLTRWSHWITPKLMKKRFDTRFFMVEMARDQECLPDNREADHGVWLTPEQSLTDNLLGKVPLSPPTVVTLTELTKIKTMQALRDEMETRQWGAPNAPRLVHTPNGPVLLEPWDPECCTDADVDSAGYADKVLKPGVDFSRLWCDKGLWKPVKD
jgi:8-oxo-dGTP pyrophosphatase MutT (NUDIX family)